MRYLVFAGYEHYPRGGAGDIASFSNSLKDAHEQFKELSENEEENDWVHVLDTDTMKCVYTYYVGRDK